MTIMTNACLRIMHNRGREGRSGVPDERVALQSDRGDICRRMSSMYLRDKRLNGCLRYAQTVALESDPPTRPRHRQMPHAIVFNNDCFNMNFQIFDS